MPPTSPDDISRTFGLELHVMTEKEKAVGEQCVQLLRTLPFDMAMCIMANMLVSSCVMMGVERELVLRMVSSVYDGADSLRKPGAQG